MSSFNMNQEPHEKRFRSSFPSTIPSSMANNRILLPIKNLEQGRFAIKTLLSDRDATASEIRLLHCIENKLARPTFFSSFEAISLADEQTDQVDESHHFLEQLGKELVDAFPEARITVKSSLVDSVHDGILQEAKVMQATKIVLVTEPERKLRWFIPEISTRIMRNATIPVHVIKPARENKHNGRRIA